MEKIKHNGPLINSLILCLFLPLTLLAQQTLTLEECFDRITTYYPLSKQTTLLRGQASLDISTINKGKLPKLDINAQASYQSDVTSLPIQLPNTTIDPPNKDQYRATLDANLMIYDGGFVNAKAKLKESSAQVGQQEVEVNLYALKKKVSNIYLSILLLQENRTLLEVKEKQLQTRIDEVKAGVAFGTLLPSSSDALLVELLKIKQKFTELDHSKWSLLKHLSLLTGIELNETAILQPPIISITKEAIFQRPEITLFELQKDQIDFSMQQLSKSKLPKVNAFAQGGYGNPGLNMLDNSFKTFYITGLRFNWNIFDWNKTKNERQSLEINKEIINAQKETFELNNSLELVQLQSEMDKLEEYIAIDQEIIPLRENIVKTAASQLKNGVITSSAYISEFTDLYEAKSNLALHKTQLLQHQIEYQITKGHP